MTKSKGLNIIVSSKGVAAMTCKTKIIYVHDYNIEKERVKKQPKNNT